MVSATFSLLTSVVAQPASVKAAANRTVHLVLKVILFFMVLFLQYQLVPCDYKETKRQQSKACPAFCASWAVLQ